MDGMGTGTAGFGEDFPGFNDLVDYCCCWPAFDVDNENARPTNTGEQAFQPELSDPGSTLIAAWPPGWENQVNARVSTVAAVTRRAEG